MTVLRRGDPVPTKICNSHAERENLTIRMQVRRLTRLTNALSKTPENHKRAIALHLSCYNFCLLRGTLRVTPAMEGRITDHVWNIAELLA